MFWESARTPNFGQNFKHKNLRFSFWKIKFLIMPSMTLFIFIIFHSSNGFLRDFLKMSLKDISAQMWKKAPAWRHWWQNKFQLKEHSPPKIFQLLAWFFKNQREKFANRRTSSKHYKEFASTIRPKMWLFEWIYFWNEQHRVISTIERIIQKLTLFTPREGLWGPPHHKNGSGN